MDKLRTLIREMMLLENLFGAPLLAEEVGLRDRIIQAMDKLPKSGTGAVTLTALRPMIGGTRDEQDNELKQMQRDGLLVLYRQDNPRALKPADHEAAMDVGGFPRHLVIMDTK